MASTVDITIKATDEASGVIEGVTGKFGEFGDKADEVKGSGSDAFGELMDSVNIAMLGINAAIEVGIKAFDALKGVYEATVGKTLEIAGEIEELSRVSGDAPENMSALRVAAQEAGVDIDDLYKALENLNKTGVAPTVDNLVAIADEYVNLQDPIEKAKLLTDNFGAAGDEIAPMLEAIADGVKAVDNAGLIFTEEEIQQAKDYETAVADLALAWEGFVSTIGMKVIPGLTDFLTQFQNSISSVSLMTEYIGLLNEKYSEDKDIKAYLSGIGELMSINLASAEGVETLQGKYDALYQALYGDALAAGAAAQAHDDLVMSIFENSTSWEDFTAKMGNAGISLGMLTEDIYDAEKQAGMTAAELAALNEIDIDDKEFTVKALIDSSDVDNWEAPPKYGSVRYSVSGPAAYAEAAGGAVYAAAGVAASMPYYWVGERGPEPFFPSVDGRIVSNTQAMAALRGGTNSEQIADAVKQGIKDAMRDSKTGNVYNLTMPTSSNPADVRTAFELMEAWNA